MKTTSINRAYSNDATITAQIEKNLKSEQILNKLGSYGFLRACDYSYDESLINDYEYITSLDNVSYGTVYNGEATLLDKNGFVIELDDLRIMFANYAAIYTVRLIASNKSIQNRLAASEVAEIDPQTLANEAWAVVFEKMEKRIADRLDHKNSYIIQILKTVVEGQIMRTSKQAYIGYQLQHKQRQAYVELQKRKDEISKEEFIEEFNRMTGRQGKRKIKNSLPEALYNIMTSQPVFIDQPMFQDQQDGADNLFGTQTFVTPSKGDDGFANFELQDALQHCYKLVELPEFINEKIKTRFVADCVQVLIDEMTSDDLAIAYKIDPHTAHKLVDSVKAQLAQNNNLYTTLKCA